MSQQEIIELLTAYAYEPWLVYGFIFAMLTASSFGLPIPEEVTLIAAGIVGHFALHPEDYPPPYPGAEPVNPYTLAVVSFLAVFLSDLLIYWLGRFGGYYLRRSEKLKRLVESAVFKRAESLIQKYGAWMAGVFRFTPGLRFPGHLACGLARLPQWKFWLVDGTAALLTVPTQILLVAFYGEAILEYIKQFKMVIAVIIVLILAIVIVRKLRVGRFSVGPS